MTDEDKPARAAAPDAKQYHKNQRGEASSEIIEQNVASGPKGRLRGLWQWALAHRQFSIPAVAALLLVLVFALPLSRYAVLGLFLKQEFAVLVLDSQTNKPVSSATVVVAGVSATTDGEGLAKAKVPVGKTQLSINKQYYRSFSTLVTVKVGKAATPFRITLEATGRVVPVEITNRINGKQLAGMTIKADKTEAKTDEKGQATLVVPADVKEVKATVSGNGYNTAEVTVKVTTQEDRANNFVVTPSGKVYFLSNQSGNIDVVKSDLDGKNRQIVLAGTGKENKGETVLLATRDWKYLALQSRRDGGDNPKLFLISTSDDSVTTMDEGDARFTLTGWEGHRFLFVVNRNKVEDWTAKKQALKSYDADAKKLTTIDQTVAEGSNAFDYTKEYFSTVYVLAGRVLYAKSWYGSYYSSVSNKQVALVSVNPDGSDKKTIKTFSPNPSTQTSFLELATLPYGPDELYLNWQNQFFEYEDGKVVSLPSMTADAFYSSEYATYLASPSGKQTFWSQGRDGKLAFMTGTASAEDEKKITTLGTDYQTYGWFTDDYLLVSKNGSELFIMPTTGVEKEEQLAKVTDYYRPHYLYRGYGGGYGGL